MKKWLAALLGITMMFSIAGCSEEKKAEDIKELEILDSGECGDDVTYTLTADGVLTISGKGEIGNVPWEYDNYEYINDIKKLVVNEGVEDLSIGMCWKCTNLKEVELPEGIKTIPAIAFANTKIESIVLPKSCEEIQTEAFSDCTELKAINLENCTSIERAAFSGCTNLSDVKLSEELTWINNYTFANCIALKEIYIPENVRVEGNAFANCEGIVIHGKAGSDAENYATVNNLQFVAE